VSRHEVVVHCQDIPQKDITCVDGIRCTTPLRTVIDLAPEVDAAQLRRMVKDCLNRGLFTVEEASSRLAEDDMRTRPAALLVHAVLEFGADPPDAS
jgi:hypothetical protein